MKHLYIAVVLILSIAQATPLLADAASDQYYGQWQWWTVASASNGVSSYDYWRGTIGASPEATDGYDGELSITPWDIPTTYAAVFHEEGINEWDAPTGFYLDDYVDLLIPGQVKTWQIYVWSSSNMPVDYDAMYLHMTRTDNTAFTGDFQFRLRLVSKPESVSGGPEVGTTWNLDSPRLGLDVALPTCRTDNGLNGYHFEMSATAVPEPASLLALAVGLAGLVIKRRR